MKYFKQIVLAAFVVGAYILYSFHQRSEDNVAVGVPATSPDTATSTPTPGSASAGTSTTAPSATASGAYKDGTYTGSSANAFYGYIQVKAIVSGGKLTNVQFLSYPNDRRQSISINTQAMPILKQEAISAQSSNVDTVTGATDTSDAFVQSLGAALAMAK